MLLLLQNEVNKILAKRKLLLITGILIVLVSLFAYGQHHQYQNTIDRYTSVNGNTAEINWQNLVRQQIADLTDRLNSPYTHESNINSIKVRIQQNQYYLNNNINPITPTAGKFAETLMSQAIFLLLPLLIIILSGDSVCSEFSSKTIKILLTRAVPRWKILLSKYIALLILISVVILETAVLSLIISGAIFKGFGFMEPVATGFKVIAGKLDASNVVKVFEWQYLILVYSLGWLVAVAVGTISFMVSVLVRNTATSIGVMMATLIGGSFLQLFLADWPSVKYFFVLNLNLPQYLSGTFQPVAGMNMLFSTLVLLGWTIVALFVSFTVFEKQDVLV
jgi:ABC-2 type transport system permease protein